MEGSARYVGGMLDGGAPLRVPIADAVVQMSLLPQDARGRSRVKVSMTGTLTIPIAEIRIHGSGPQRLRRAAYGTLERVREELIAG